MFNYQKHKKCQNASLLNAILLEVDRVAGIGDEPLAKAVLALCHKVHNSSHRGLCQQCQVDNPVVFTQHIYTSSSKLINKKC